MNELQKKLARRRSLNGELFANLETPTEVGVSAALSPKSATDRKEIVPQSAAEKNGKTNELQSKLARRREKNGETGSSPDAAEPLKLPAVAAAATEIMAPNSLNIKDSETNQPEASQSRTNSLADSEGPAWLNDYVSSVQSREPFRTAQPAEDVQLIVDEHVPAIDEDIRDGVKGDRECSIDGDDCAACPKEESADRKSGEHESSSPPTAETETETETETGTKTEIEMEAKFEDTLSSPVELVAPVVSVNPVIGASTPVKEGLFNEPVESILTSDSTNSGESDHSPAVAEAKDMVPALHDVPSRSPSPLTTPSAAAAVVADSVDSPDASAIDATGDNTMLAQQQIVAEESKQVDVKLEVKRTQMEQKVSDLDATPKHGPSAQSPQRSRGGWSPMRSTTKTAPIIITTSSDDTGSGVSYPRANTNPGSSPHGGVVSPLRRSASLTGMTPTNQPNSIRKTSWYPGKFLLEGPSGWGSKNTTPMIKMNPDQARSHYADLMSSSAKGVPKASASGAKRGAQSSDKQELTRQEQRQADLRTANISESAAAGTSDDIIDMVLQLSRENSQLKKEVAHLKDKLAHQQVLLDAFQGTSIEEVVSDGAESSHSTAAERRDQYEADAVTTRPSLSQSQQSSDTPHHSAAVSLAADSDHTLERTSFTETLTPTASASASKSRASRRFGARNYYSSFQSEESEDGLFGSDEAVEEIGRNNKFKALTFEDLDSDEIIQAKKLAEEDGSSAEQSLDTLLRSVTGSGSKDRDSVGRALVAEKYLVQSFRSTGANPTKRMDAQGGSDAPSDWQARFGHLGLIAADPQRTQSEDKQLFNEEIDAIARQRAAATQAREATMDYEEFIGKFTRTNELVDMTREFISSVLGPNGDATAPTSRKKLSYNFYGTHKLDIRCRQFFDQIQDLFLTWPEFKHETDERLICARDSIEQYVMSRIAEFAFKSSVDSEGDDILSKRMKLLSFLKPEALDIKPELFNETLLAIAADELRKINACKTPGDKVACVVKSASVIFRSLSLSRTKTDTEHSFSSSSTGAGADDTNIAGADDFLPLFIWVVMRSHIPRLCSNVAYVQNFLNPARLMGKWGYCLINLSSAIEFVKYIESDQLIIDPKEFDTKLTEAERELNGGFL